VIKFKLNGHVAAHFSGSLDGLRVHFPEVEEWIKYDEDLIYSVKSNTRESISSSRYFYLQSEEGLEIVFDEIEIEEYK
jgi:hypothetical protein